LDPLIHTLVEKYGEVTTKNTVIRNHRPVDCFSLDSVNNYIALDECLRRYFEKLCFTIDIVKRIGTVKGIDYLVTNDNWFASSLVNLVHCVGVALIMQSLIERIWRFFKQWMREVDFREFAYNSLMSR
jgi:hypothetical protein